MNVEMKKLIQDSVQGDPQAFGRIVEQYQGVVCAMAYSVTGDLIQSEDLAQDAFVIAWQKLGGLKKHDSIAAWLCGIARNLARDWMRKHTKIPTIPLDKVTEAKQPTVDSPEESTLRQERSKTVWAALAAIPETYREPLILFYRQDRSIRDIAEALDLSEDCVKQRLSRGRKMLRKEVARMVEETLEDSRPGKAFTAGVLAALPTLGIPSSNASGGENMGLSTVSASAKLKLLTVATIMLLVLGGLWNFREFQKRKGESLSTSKAPMHNPITFHPVSSDPTESVSESSQQASNMSINTAIDSDTGDTNTALQDGATVSGVVVFQDSNEPAEGMRVMFGAGEGEPQTTITDTEGRFIFSGIAGECVLMAYDARYEEVPEDWLRSEHVELNLSVGETRNDIRIEVPPQGGQITGQVFNKKTGEPLPGITVAAIRMGEVSYTGKSDQNGHYTVIGLMDGEWLVHVDENNQVFSSGLIKTMHTVFIEKASIAQLDIAVNIGNPISGKVVDSDGNPVAVSHIRAYLFLPHNNRLSCYFKSKEDGSFTVFGATPGDRVVLSAREGDLESHIAVVNPVPDVPVEDILLTLRPVVRVSGRFVDERGRPVKACLWRRPIHADGNGIWSGQIEASEIFEIEFAQGKYEVKGQPEDNNYAIKQPIQQLDVGSNQISNLSIKVVTSNELTGEYSINGVVIDEEGQPLDNMRIYVRGRSRENAGSFQETHSDDLGRFYFDGLLDDRYSVRATTAEPYEEYPGYDATNPADTSEITIVVRLAAKLTGKVVDSETGNPITHFKVEIGELLSGNREGRWEQKTLSSGTGAFELPTRLEKDWYLRIIADGYIPATETGLALYSGETVDEIDFKLSPSRNVRGMVTNESGEPVTGALIYHNEDVFDFIRQRVEYASAQTDAEGYFELKSLPEEAQFLYAFKLGINPGYAIAQAVIEKEMHIELTQGGTIEGHVLIGGIAPREETWVRAVASINGQDSIHGAKSDDNGYYIIRKLMSTKYRFTVYQQNETHHITSSYTLEDSVEAVNGTTTTYNITIPWGTVTVTGTRAIALNPRGH